MFEFEKEAVLPATDPRSPFYINIPSFDSKPIDALVSFFKSWKHFIKSLIYYLREVAMVKEFEANLNYQLIYSLQFPGFKELPEKIAKNLDTPLSPTTSQATTPVKELNKTLSSSGLNTQTSSTTHGSGTEKRPNLFKTKSNNTFLKNNHNANTHNRNASTNSMSKITHGHNNNSIASFASLPITSHSGMNDVKIPTTYFPDNSLFNNLPPMLIKHHAHLYQAQTKLHKELNGKLIPRLETLGKNLSLKIKEIRSSLKNDSFANPELIKEISKTGRVLASYSHSIQRYSNNKPVLKHSTEYENNDEEEDQGQLDDPFLLKLQVDYQIKNQLIKENYIFASYVNLQNISKELFTFLFKELNVIADKFGKLVSSESVYMSNNDSLVNLYLNLKKSVSNSSNSDWEYFVAHNSNLLNVYFDVPNSPKREIRSFKDLVIPYSDLIHNKCIRYGMLYRKSKILKNYHTSFYVLTCNYLHEFKIENESNSQAKKRDKNKIGGYVGYDDVPVKSYNLNEYSSKIKDEKSFKFMLIKNSNSSKKYTFKCKNEEQYKQWCGDLFELLKFGKDHLSRFSLIDEKTREASGTPQTPPPTKESTPAMNRDPGLKLDNFHFPKVEESLSAIFTPSVKTPLALSPDEGNPFDTNFLDGIPTAGQGTTSAAPSPKLSPTTEHVFTDPSHKEQHELYLKIQQEALRQNRLADAKKDTTPSSSDSAQNTDKSNSNHSRNSSTDSFNSFTHKPNSNIEKMLNNGHQLLAQTGKPVVFTFDNNSSDKMDTNDNFDTDSRKTDEKPSNQSSSDLPKVFVSSNH